MDWKNLSSGLIGALIGSIVGGILSYIAAIKGAKVTMRESARLDEERRRRADSDLREQILSHLLQEIEDNTKLAEKVQIVDAKVRFLDEAYELAKQNVRILPSHILEKLRPSYVEIFKYNILADYEQEKIAYGGGYLNKALEKQAEAVKSHLTPARDAVTKAIGNTQFNG